MNCSSIYPQNYTNMDITRYVGDYKFKGDKVETASEYISIQKTIQWHKIATMSKLLEEISAKEKDQARR